MNIGRYQIIEQLGSGAMGAVYKANDPMMGREVAIKTILPHAIEGPQSAEFRERFFREARAAGRLAHPGIVTVYDVAEHEGMPFLVMEFVAGRTLEAILRSGERLDFERICNLGIQLAEALDYAHRNDVIHRDIKPSNILIADDGRLKVTDFGVARLIDSQATATGQFLGTPSFMAPEQFAGGPIDSRADLFAVGVVLYWMTTGDKPFAGDSLVAVQYKVMHTDPVPPRRLNPAIPRGLEAVILKSMAKDPAERYPYAREIARDLAGVRDGAIRPIAARGGSSEFGDAPTLMTGQFPELPDAAGRTGKAPRASYAIAIVIGMIALLSAAGIIRTVIRKPVAQPDPAPITAVTPAPAPGPLSPPAQSRAVEPKPAGPADSVKKAEPRKTDTITLELSAQDRTNVVFRSEGQPDETLIMKPGESVTLHAKKEAVLIVTNPTALQAKINGKPVSFGDQRRAGQWVVTPEGLDDSLSRLLRGNPFDRSQLAGIQDTMNGVQAARGNRSGLSSAVRQRELTQAADSVRLLIKSSAVPEFLTVVVRVDNEQLFRRDATAEPPAGFNQGQMRFDTGTVSVVPLAEERLLPAGVHKVQVSALSGYVLVGRPGEISANFEPGQRSTLLIEFVSEAQRGRGRGVPRLQVTLQ